MDEAWERAVEVACGGEDPQSVRSLTLDGAVKCSQGRLPAKPVLEKFTQLRVLSIANVGLTALVDFPSLKHLERLILSDNRISGGLDFLVAAGLRSLRDLDLSNNKIQQLDELAPLAQLNLLSLDLYECPITRLENYRSKVFHLIKSLQYLDKVDAENNERPESDEEEDDNEDDVEDDGVDDEDQGYTVGKIRSNGRAERDEEDEEDDGEGSDGLDEEDDENVAEMNHVGQSNDESGSEEEEVDDDEDTEQVLEVQDIDESEDDGGDEDDEDEDDENEDEGDDTEQAAAGALDEIGVHAEGEENSEIGDEDDEGDEGVDDDDEGEEDEENDEDDDEEEDLGTEYLVRPIVQAEDEEAASDFEPGDGDDVDDDDDIEDDDEDDAGPAAASAKRKRGKEDGDEDKEDRPPKK